MSLPSNDNSDSSSDTEKSSKSEVDCEEDLPLIMSPPVRSSIFSLVTSELKSQDSQPFKREPVSQGLNIIGILMSSVTRIKLKTQVIRLTSKSKEHSRYIRAEFSDATIHAFETCKTVEDLLDYRASFGSSLLRWSTKAFFKSSKACSIPLSSISSISHMKDSSTFKKATTPSDLPGISVLYVAQGQQKSLDLLFPDYSVYKIWAIALEMLHFAANGIKLVEEDLSQIQLHWSSLRSP